MTINFDQYTNTLSVTDTAANADLTYVTKGTGSHVFNTVLGTGFKVADPGGGGSINNWWQAQGYSSSPGLAVAGSGTNVGGNLTSKGTGSLGFQTNNFGQLQFNVTHTASAVNYVQVTGAATGSSPQITTQGSDAIISLILRTKGTGSNVLPQFDGSVFFQNLASQNQFRVFNTASAVNYLQTGGSVAGSELAIQATGSDTNIDLAFTPKGTGNVRFGTYTANMALTIQGYIEIKDSGGTVRRLAVIA
jgi:hypothetical protein